MQIEQREKQRQTASKGAMRIFTPLFEVAIKVQGVLNWEQNENNNNKINLHSKSDDLVHSSSAQFLLSIKIIVTLITLHFQHVLN